MQKCKYCNAIIPVGKRECEKCGAFFGGDETYESTEKKNKSSRCSKCGFPLLPDAKFCNKCGLAVLPETESSLFGRNEFSVLTLI